MVDGGFSSGDQFLIESAKAYFFQTYQNPVIQVSVPLDKTLGWVPTLSLRINSHLTLAAEVSETVYPQILSMRRLAIIKLQIPIAVYCVCAEETYLSQQAAAKELMGDGFGLVTVDSEGVTTRRSPAIPLMQQIITTEFTSEIKQLPLKIKRRVAESFERYNFNAPSGTADIAEVMEGMILRAGRDAALKKWIPASDAKAGKPAATLAAMDSAKQFGGCRAAIGAAQGFINMYRNNSHHFPKDRKQAARKYNDCKHGFIEGIKKLCLFREAMKNIGLSGDL